MTFQEYFRELNLRYHDDAERRLIETLRADPDLPEPQNFSELKLWLVHKGYGDQVESLRRVWDDYRLGHDFYGQDKYAAVIDKLAQLDARSDDVNAEIHGLIEASGPILDYTGDFMAAMSLIPHGWWWHISHLGVDVVPNRPVEGIPISNATDYHENVGFLRRGGPVQYHAMMMGDDRSALPRRICEAALKARNGLFLKSLAKTHQTRFIVQTGEGPMIATREGKLIEVPYGHVVTESGRLVPDDYYHRTVVAAALPEPEDAEDA